MDCAVVIFHRLGWAVRPMIPLSKNTSGSPEQTADPSTVGMTKGRVVAVDGQCGRGFSSLWVGRKAHDSSVENTSGSPEQTADPSTPLRSGQDDKGEIRGGGGLCGPGFSFPTMIRNPTASWST